MTRRSIVAAVITGLLLLPTSAGALTTPTPGVADGFCSAGSFTVLSPTVASNTGGLSDVIVYWTAELLYWDGNAWVHYVYSPYATKNLWGGGTVFHWVRVDNGAETDVLTFNGLPAGYYAVFNWVWYPPEYGSPGGWEGYWVDTDQPAYGTFCYAG